MKPELKFMAIFFGIILIIGVVAGVASGSSGYKSSYSTSGTTTGYTSSKKEPFDPDRSKYMPGGEKYDENWYEKNHGNAGKSLDER